MNREEIWAALFAKLPTAGFNTKSRRLKHWDDVPKEKQPALFLAQGPETHVRVTGQPAKRTFTGELYVYARTDGGLDPGPVINPLLDAIEQALEPNAVEQVQTLGGLVDHCRIEGAIETDEGTLGDQLVAIIPIHMLVS